MKNKLFLIVFLCLLLSACADNVIKDDNELQQSGLGYKLSFFNSKEQNIVFDRYFYQEIDENDESRNTYEVDSKRVTYRQYESEIDNMKEHLARLEPCIDIEKMNGYDSQDKKLSYGKDFLKYVNMF